MNIRINKKYFALGGDWTQLMSGDDPVDLVKKQKKKFYTISTSDSINLQYLGSFNVVKQHSKLYCFPTFIKSIIDDEDFIFVHEFSGKIYYVAYRDNILDVKTDKALNSSEAKKQIRSYIDKWHIKNLYYFDELSNQDEYFVTDFIKLDSKDLKAVPKEYLLKNVGGSGFDFKLLLALLFLFSVIGVLAWFVLTEYFPDTPIAKKTVSKGPTAAEIKAEKESIVKNNLAKLYSTPLNDQFSDVCDDSYRSHPDTIDLWQFVSYDCVPAKLTVTYQRNDFAILPSAFEKYLVENTPSESASHVFKLPALVTGNLSLDLDQRTFVPESLNDIKPDANDNVFNVLATFSDMGMVNSLAEPKYISYGHHELQGQLIQFNESEKYKKGSFTLRSNNYQDLISAIDLFDGDYVFLSKISKKGDFYDSVFTFITL